MTSSIDELLEIRKPLDALEERVVRASLRQPEAITPTLLDALRYVISFARLTRVGTTAGRDTDVSGFLSAHAWKVRSALTPLLAEEEDGLRGAIRELPPLVAETRTMREGLLRSFPVDRDVLEQEVTQRQFVIAAGGGGGAGYGYAGAFTLFHRAALTPELIVGTSMGALIGLFRARRRHFDMAAMFEAGRRLAWRRLFRVLDVQSRYGLPATLKLDLHSTLGPLFHDEGGRVVTIGELEIPMRIITTGFTLDALKHDMAFYEHFMDEAVRGGSLGRRASLARISQLVRLFRELTADPTAVKEIVFGADPGTSDADVLDAVGFSSAIPGIIHYDMLRDDPRMRVLLDDLYAEHGIARMVEGGLVNNVPARLGFETVMKGRLGLHNPFIVALDCFPPRRRSPMLYLLQRFVRTNVERNIPFANIYFPLRRVLHPLNLVPTVEQIEQAMRWVMEQIRAELPFIRKMCAPLRVLRDG